MLWTNVRRVLRSGIVSFGRNGFVSLTAVLMMMAPLFMLASLLFSNFLLATELKNLQERVDINVYFLTSVAEEDVLEFADEVRALPEVAVVEYVSRDQVLTNFRARHENDQLTLQALDELGSNPFGAMLAIRAREVSEYAGIAQFLTDHTTSASGEPFIDNINYYQNKVAIGRLGDIINSSKSTKLVQTLFLALVALLVIFNTIRLAIHYSRDEIGVMRLVGASNRYIQGPFIVEGVMYGALAGIAVLALLFPITYWFGSYFSPFPSLSGWVSSANVFQYYVSHFPYVLIVIVGSGIVLSAISSFLAVRKYLSV